MYTIKGKYAGALITIDNLDPDAVTQLYGLLNAKASEGSKVAIMPDGHPGKDCLVGFTQKFDDDAKERLDVGSVRATLGELFTTTVDSSLDEAPDAYKRFDFIREHITPTAEVIDRLVPLYNFKG